MPKFRLLVDVDSVVEEAEHLEDLFKDGIEADNEEEAERLVEAKVKELMYGGPYYTVTEGDDDQIELDIERDIQRRQEELQMGFEGCGSCVGSDTFDQGVHLL